jgi:hypothetical protein
MEISQKEEYWCEDHAGRHGRALMLSLEIGVVHGNFEREENRL